MKKLKAIRDGDMFKSTKDVPLRKRLSIKLLIWFLTISLVPVLITGFFAYKSAQRNLERDAEQILMTSARFKTNEVRHYFDDLLSGLSLQAESNKNISLFSQLRTALLKSGVNTSDFTKSFIWKQIADDHGKDL